MRKLFFILLTSFTLTALAEPLDKIVAVVNEEVITQSELNKALEIAKMQLSQQHMNLDPKTVRQQVLDQLINKSLQFQIAKLAGVTVKNAELEHAINVIAKQNHMTVTMLYDRLQQDGLSKDKYRKELRDQILMQKLQQQEIVGHITVTEEEVSEFLKSGAWRENSEKEYHVEDILIPLKDSPSATEIHEAEKNAATIIKKINEGSSMSTAATTLTLENNDLGWRKLPEIPSLFANQLIHMNAKEVTGPIRAGNGLHVIRLTELRSLDSKQAAPTKKQVEEILFQRKMQEGVQIFISKLRSQAFIKTSLA